MRRVGFPARDVSRTWLTFLRALELARETDAGFVREQTDPTPEHLRDAFQRRVYGAREVLASLDADEPRSIEEVFTEFEARVPAWETHRAAEDWRDVWRERVEHILGWAVLLDLVEERDGGYARTE
jgi:chromatin segregation and condensation protein Rec8/ScpA/Scc1 (kleisin family)